MPARLLRSAQRRIFFTIRSIHTRKVSYGRFHISAPAFKRKIAWPLSKVWCRIFFSCRMDVPLRLAVTKKQPNAVSHLFCSSALARQERFDAFMPDGNKPTSEPLLCVRNLKKYFPVKRGLLSRVTAYVKAVDDIS